MSSLKLFRSTEFANSVQFSPAVQRIATHPFWIALLASTWLATAGNYVLWRELMRPPELGAIQGLWLGLRLALLIVAALCALLSLVSWRWTFKPALIVLFFMAALGTHIMLTQGSVIDASAVLKVLQTRPRLIFQGLLSWQAGITFMVLAVLPSLWLWRTPIRRIPALWNFLQNAIFLVIAGTVLAGVWFASADDVSGLLGRLPQLRHMTNPLNTLAALADMISR